jgi:DNA-directed RNA polymerase
MASTGYKVNTNVLDFINKYGLSYGIIFSIDQCEFHTKNELTNKDVINYQREKSKIFTQDTILDLAELYRGFNAIYFPLRLDNRGRIYPESVYFNYQGTELAKSLLLFSEPGLLKRDDRQSLEFFFYYGANCYGLDKKTLKEKLLFINENSQKIYNIEDGELLNLAKSKALFLAFALEYKRYIDYYHSDDTSPFKTYLPIQLDATCNGFQHLAMLSNENKLFEELNLSQFSKKKVKEDKPNDFYNFLLYMVINRLRKIVESDTPDKICSVETAKVLISIN